MHLHSEERRTKKKRIRRSLSWSSANTYPINPTDASREKRTTKRSRWVATILCCFVVLLNAWNYIPHTAIKDGAKAHRNGDLTIVKFVDVYAHENASQSSQEITVRKFLKDSLGIVAAPNLLVLSTGSSTCKLAMEVHPEIRCILLEKRVLCPKDLIVQLLDHATTDFVVFSSAAVSLPRELMSNIAAVSRLLKNFVLFRRNKEHSPLLVGSEMSVEGNNFRTVLEYMAFRSRILENGIHSDHAHSSNKLDWGLLLSLLSPPEVRAVEATSETRTTGDQDLDTNQIDRAIPDRLMLLKTLPWAHYMIKGFCPRCHLANNEMLSAVGLATYLADSHNIIGVTSLHSRQVDSFLNWFCWAKAIGVSNFLVISEDLTSYSLLQEMGLNTILAPDAPKLTVSGRLRDKSRLQTTNFKGTAVLSMIEAGFHVVHFRPETLWLQNPLPYMKEHCSVMTMGQQGGKHLGDFVFIRNGEAGSSFLRKFSACVKSQVSVYQKDTAAIKGYQDIEDICFGHALHLHKDRKKPRTHACKFFDTSVDSYDSFFLKRTNQRRGTWPLFLRYKEIAPSNVEGILQQHGMWLSQNGKCLQGKVPSRPRRVASEYHLIIRVLTFSRASALQRLLNSLANADYRGKDNVRLSLQLSVDHPGEEAGPELREAHAKVVSIAKKFEWKFGVYEIFVQPSPQGLLAQWTGSWAPSDDQEILLVLEDDTEVSPLYFQFLTRMIEKYYFNPLQFDPQMYGFGLQRQSTIIGREQVDKPAKDITKELGGEVFYKYQLVCTWGAVFFPQHWKEFVRWFVEHRRERNFDPCLPNTASTLWYNTKGKSSRMWSIWFIRFAFEKGWYNMYLNLPDGSALVTNHREGGLNFKEHRGPSNPLTVNPAYIGMELPSTEDIPVYDYFFNRISSPGALGNRIQQYSVLSKSEMCEPGKIYD